MNCEQIEKIISELKVDSLGRIRNKNKVIDKIHSEHLKSVDSTLSDRLPNAEDIKRWYQLLVGKSEEAMQKDIEHKFHN